MAEDKTLTPPPALYDYVLYYECAAKDWIGGKSSVKTNVKGDGSLMNHINWNIDPSYDPDDSGGNTKFGVTHGTWKGFVDKYPNKGYNKNLTSMNKQGWLDVIEYFWNTYSCGGKSANYACAFALFQMAWGGFSESNLKKLLKTLKENADKKDYSFLDKGRYYAKIADATHAYSDPMVAYDYIRKAKSTYLYNISTPDRTNKKYRCGWLTRNTLSFTPYGLFICKSGYANMGKGLRYESTLAQWEQASIELAKENKSGYVKIFDWGASPESIEKITSNSYDLAAYGSGGSNNYSGGITGGNYNGCGGVYQLGNYSNTSDMVITPQQTQNREEVLNTLVNNSYTPEQVKKCSELITADKKKGVKEKSES
jgi:hypothetical protein